MSLSLVACGKIFPAPEDPTPTQPNPVNADNPRGVTGTPATPLNADLAEVFKLVNEKRAQERMCGNTFMAKAKPLVYNSLLAEAARKHAEDMGYGGFYNHVTQQGAIHFPVGSTVTDRVKLTGFSQLANSEAGEIMVAGGNTTQDRIQAWLESPAHCEVLMSPSIIYVGLGEADEVKLNADFAFNHYLVMNMSN